MEISMLYQPGAEIKTLTDCPDELLVRAQNGGREAFGLIFEQHHRFVYKFIYAMVGNESRAEELAQETFLGAYKGISALRGDAKLRTWLCGIAKNTVYKSFRANNKEGIRSEDEIESLAIADDKNPAPDKEILSKELNLRIHAALEKLDENKRLIFTLKELQHLSYQEIAEITGYSIPKLKTDLHRAKAEMRACLRSYLEVKQ